ncbi:nuclear transport factor 2 family protein [Chromobacterium phragmitis]|uniref:Nuclear transport factor 2 family protein n=1 Tax=Chromobacterium phragmitis TaxID=2202141 RepID=A0A344UE21_9NEIS|nr:nuclear transport factor 2 family protein [Chromobacterium phragmitis]AXE32127.1 nuclear transport factor 2 family protein [Chromobacterium phragmitis]AXE33519.1 nuclear transport factor 2 family protein [Chromobacterium phragmitis]
MIRADTPRQALDGYKLALATHDWRQVAPWLHEDACFVFSDGTFKGKPAVCEAIRQTFEAIRGEDYRIDDLHWTHIGDAFAACVYAFAWRGLVDGQPAEGRGRGSCALIKDERGWRLLQEHLGPPAES